MRRRSRWLGRYRRGLKKKASPREGIFTFGFDEIKNSDHHADGDEAVGKIERRPVKVRPVDIEKIDNFAIGNPIDQIADGAAENKGERGNQARFAVAQPSQHDDDKADRQDGNTDQKGQPKNFVRFRTICRTRRRYYGYRSD